MVLYLAGRMSGLPDLNYPAFFAAALRLRKEGHVVINPAENFGGVQDLPYETYLAKSLRQVTRADAIALLPGWERSRGVAMELTVAGFLDKRLVDAETLQHIDYPRHVQACLTALAQKTKQETKKDKPHA